MPYRDKDLAQVLEWIDQGLREVRVTGLSGTARAFFLSLLFAEMERPCLVVLPLASEAASAYKELQFFLPEAHVLGGPGERRLYDFPVYDVSPLTGLSPHKEITTRRIQALYVLPSEKRPIVITSIEALLLRVLPKEEMIRAVEYLCVEEEVERDVFLRRLEANGYLRTSLVEERGDYSVRGGVIDVFPPLYPYPVRLEFWGDRLESIRYFETLSQRSTEALDELILLPANEIIMGQENVKRARSMGRLPRQVGEAGGFPGQEAWLNHFYACLDGILSYFPEGGLLTLVDTHRMQGAATRFLERFQKDVERCRQEAWEREVPFPEVEGIPFCWEELRHSFETYQSLVLDELAVGKQETSQGCLHVQGPFKVEEPFDLRLGERGRVSLAPLAQKIASWLEMGSRVVFVCRTEQQAHRLRGILGNYHVEVHEEVGRWEKVSRGKGLSICLGRLFRGFVWPALGVYVISEDEVFGPKRYSAKKGAPARMAALDWSAFGQLKIGDLVVHQDHGIGLYGGLSKMEVEERVNDFVIIEYADSDRLYVPADRISVLQKYVGADEGSPKLDRLGGRAWDLAKQKARKSVREIARQLLDIYAVRKYRKGFAFSSPDPSFREFEASFEHEETPDQIRTIQEILGDMEADRPMDRLVCGDVGFGKTEVAVRSAFKAVADGKQVALLVPTTVLAEQHYETFRKRMTPYRIRVEVLSRFKSKADQKEIISRVRSREVDILIGTHRILQKDVGFKDLGLLIIDEEQRFGVKQKEELKKYRVLVDVLALTATPIPRTLHLSLMGIRDLSVIETPPEDRLAIQSYLTPYDEPTIVRAIEAELDRGGQVFFVHNRVQTIETMRRRIADLVPRARLAIAHGQMKESDLEKTMLRFLRREIDVLVCTTIIESGLDIPSVNTIIINEVDRFGLAQIYQLRGRVGRSNEVAFAYLLLSGDAQLTREAEKRLKALMDFSHLGAGIQLALHDLKIRGGGNILGFSQAGHISAIGYELYLKMVEQTIAELKGEEWKEEVNPEINVNIPAYLPSHYISDTDVRLNAYRRLSALREPSELEAMRAEMQDRFGLLPAEVANLLEVVSVRLLMKKAGLDRLDVAPMMLTIGFSHPTRIDPAKLVALVAKDPRRFQLTPEGRMRIKVRGKSPMEGLLEARDIIGGFYEMQQE